MYNKGVQILANTALTSLGPILSGPADFEVFRFAINRLNSSRYWINKYTVFTRAIKIVLK